MAIDPASTYLLLKALGDATQYPCGDAFWSKPASELNAIGRGWLVSEHVFNRDWLNWEMHTRADEVVYLLEGEAQLLLELPSGLAVHRILGRGVIVVPKGVWHTAKASVPCRMLHIIMGEGTQHRPVAQ